MKEQPRSFSWPFYIDHVENFACYTDAFSISETEKIIEYAKEYRLIKAMTSGNNEQTNVRNNQMVFIGPEGIEWAYQRITEIVHELNSRFFRFDIFGFIEGLQFTEYNAPGQFYKDHIDKLNRGKVRKLSVVIQLTDEKSYDGGDLELILGTCDDVIKMDRKRGNLIVFPSYVLHRVTSITKGQRHSLVGWVTGKPFV